MSRSFLTSLLVVICVAGPGCRMPKLYLSRNTQPPVVYDTAWERGGGDVRLASHHVDHDSQSRFCDTLAEPVAVIDWKPGVSSTWQILYATNRGRTETEDARKVQYGNTVKESPEYGVCAVTLPHRDRGTDARTADTERAGSLPQWLARWSERDEPSSDSLAELNAVQPLDDDAFFARLNDLVVRSRQRDVLVFVHGFNVSYEQAVLRATQVAADIPFNGAIVVYSWPSQGGMDHYERDGEIIDESRDAFVEFLTQLGARLPAEVDINLMAHSMGNRLVVGSVWHLPDEFTEPPRFREIVLCAPDVGFDEFQRAARRIVELSDRATMYKNCNDTALIVSKWKNFDERAGESFRPVLVAGMDTIETTVVDTSLLGHSYYGSNRSILRDLFAVLKEHRPAADREWLDRKQMPFVATPWWIIAEFPRELEWTWHFEEDEHHTSVSAIEQCRR